MDKVEGPGMRVRRTKLASKACPCGSGRPTRECHSALLAPPTQEQFFVQVEQGLDLAPHLKRVMPKGFPRRGRAKLDYAKTMLFEEERTSRHSHNLNLPLVLHLAANPDSIPGVKAMARMLLGLLDAFVERFDGTPGFQGVLNPLWTQALDCNDPCFWSVSAHCYLALRYGEKVTAFERPTGHEGKKADLLLATKHGQMFVEVECWHAPGGRTAEELAAEFRRRVEAKASSKFLDLELGTIGVIVQFAFFGPTQLQVLREHRELLEPIEITRPRRCIGQLLAALHTADERGRITGLDIIDFNTPIGAPPPSSS